MGTRFQLGDDKEWHRHPPQTIFATTISYVRTYRSQKCPYQPQTISAKSVLDGGRAGIQVNVNDISVYIVAQVYVSIEIVNLCDDYHVLHTINWINCYSLSNSHYQLHCYNPTF